MLEVLIEKHPKQRIPIAEDFMPCDPLPTTIQLTITNTHIEKLARKLSGSAGISGFDSFQLQRVLMRFGKQIENLRESFIKAISRQADAIVPWKISVH